MATTSSIEKSQHADQEKRRVALSSVLAAIFLTAIKITIGLITGSLGILSEAAHSGLDLVAAAVTFFAVRISGQPPDSVHTYGHGKVENLSALFETFLLLITCVWIIYEAIQRLFFKSVEVEASIWAFIIMAVSIAIDFTRSRALGRIAKKYDSQALEADALHFSTDIWSSSVVIGGLILVSLAGILDLPWLAHADAVAALGVAVIVVYVSLQLGRKTVTDLLDAIPPGVRDEVTHAVRHVPGVLEIQQARIRRSGPEAFVDLTLKISRDTPLELAHEVAIKAEAAVHSVLPGADVIVNVTPIASDHEGLLTTVRMLAARQGLSAHGIRIYNIEDQHSLELHLEVSESLSLEEAHTQAEKFEAAVRAELPDIQGVTTHIEPTGEAAMTRQPLHGTLPADEALILQVLREMAEDRGIECDFHDLVVRRIAGELSVSFNCWLESGIALTEAHALTDRAEQALRARVPNLGRVVIHVEPAPTDQPEPPPAP